MTDSDIGDTILCTLHMTRKQFAALNDCVIEWGESPEETIAIACRGALRAENQPDWEK